MKYSDLIDRTNRDNKEIISLKPSVFEYLFVFMLILYAGRSNKFFESGSITENPIGVILPVILSGILALRWRVVYNIQFYILVACFFIYFLGISIKYNEVQPSFFLVYFFLFFTAYTAIKALKVNLFIIYEKLIFYLAIIGLFMWVVQTVLGGDSLYYKFASIPFITKNSFVTYDGLNAILYSVQPTYASLLYNFAIPRNCGFAWEPGSFSVYLCLAIFINLFIAQSEKGNNLRFWVLVAALASTLSTTGYILFMAIMLFHIINKNMKRVILLFPVVIAVVIIMFSLPFMKNKIVDLITETNSMDRLLRESYGREDAATPQRFLSFKVAFVDFKNNPVLGLGAHREDSWTYKMGSRISTISGIGNLLAQFGIVGFLVFIILTLKNSFFFAEHFSYRGKYLLFIVMILISVSYSMLFMPLIMSFWMFSSFESQIPVVNVSQVES